MGGATMSAVSLSILPEVQLHCLSVARVVDLNTGLLAQERRNK